MQTCNNKEFIKVLLDACPNVYHDKAHEEPNEFIVWTEIGENGFRAENGVDEYAERYSVAVYTQEEFSDIPDKLRYLFSENDYAWEDPTVYYDEKTNYKVISYAVEVT